MMKYRMKSSSWSDNGGWRGMNMTFVLPVIRTRERLDFGSQIVSQRAEMTDAVSWRLATSKLCGSVRCERVN